VPSGVLLIRSENNTKQSAFVSVNREHGAPPRGSHPVITSSGTRITTNCRGCRTPTAMDGNS
jgi:hypothetical protein